MADEYTIEELKTLIGWLMGDIRDTWKYTPSVIERLDIIDDFLRLLIIIAYDEGKDDVKQLAEDDLECITEYYGDILEDGRYLRDGCELYLYSSEAGKTKRVYKYLEQNCCVSLKDSEEWSELFKNENMDEDTNSN